MDVQGIIHRAGLGVMLLLGAAASSVAADYVPGELIVTYGEGSVTAVRSSLPPGSRLTPLTGDTVRVILPPGQDMAEMRRRLSGDPRIRHVQPNYIKRIQLLPDDPTFSYQWAMMNTGQSVPDGTGAFTSGTSGADVRATSAWDVTTGSPDVVIAVIDTGMALNHPDLAANLWNNPLEVPGNGVDDDANGYVDDIHGWDWIDNDASPADGNGHGSYVAGVIAARGNNGRQIAGLNWRASLMVLRTFDRQGVSSTDNIVAAVRYAVDQGAKVINASYGSQGAARPGAPDFDQAEYDAYRYARDHGVLVVAAACNDGRSNDASQACVPASYDLSNILSVAASDMNDRLAGFSNWGSSVDLAAPGVTIATTAWRSTSPDTLALVDGTSIASSFVSGAAALLLARAEALGLKPSLNTLRQLITDNVDVLPALAGRVASSGRLNVSSALAALEKLPGTQQLGGGDVGTSGSPQGGAVSQRLVAASGGGGGALDLSLLLLVGIVGFIRQRRDLLHSGRAIPAHF
ncbi:MAG TPA: hypothetical protein ENK48_00290 [Gammaproteobacteria bacterium]|nr:hypothetical protein [Gammaproteobacteria bacterium]